MLIRYLGFYEHSFLWLVGCFSMMIWTPAVLSFLYARVLYFCICTCSGQLSLFQMERRSRNTLIMMMMMMMVMMMMMMMKPHQIQNKQLVTWR